LSLKKIWNDQYDGVKISSLKDINLFNKEVESIISTSLNFIKKSKKKKLTILELGCGSGELIRRMDKIFISKKLKCKFIGVDFSKKAINQANSFSKKNQNFQCSDFLSYIKNLNSKSVDLVITQRSIMAVMKKSDQKNILKEINRVLNIKGCGIFSECFVSGLIKFNKLRKIAKLNPIKKVWHSLYLLETTIEKIFDDVKYLDFCSTYMMITRIIYPFFREPIHNEKIHDIAFSLPNSGTNSFLKIAIVNKKKR